MFLLHSSKCHLLVKLVIFWRRYLQPLFLKWKLMGKVTSRVSGRCSLTPPADDRLQAASLPDLLHHMLSLLLLSLVTVANPVCICCRSSQRSESTRCPVIFLRELKLNTCLTVTSTTCLILIKRSVVGRKYTTTEYFYYFIPLKMSLNPELHRLMNSPYGKILVNVL